MWIAKSYQLTGNISAYLKDFAYLRRRISHTRNAMETSPIRFIIYLLRYLLVYYLHICTFIGRLAGRLSGWCFLLLRCRAVSTRYITSHTWVFCLLNNTQILPPFLSDPWKNKHMGGTESSLVLSSNYGWSMYIHGLPPYYICRYPSRDDPIPTHMQM